MTEVEKLYELAGVEKECKIHTIDWQSFKEYFYPSFTAERQLELIKWLGSKYGLYIVDRYSIGFGECVGDFCTKEDFEEALAGSINSLWQSLTEEEKQQIKEILQ